MRSLAELTDEKKKVLIVGRFDETTYKAGRNVKAVQLTTADQVNTENLLHYNKILITREALDEVAARTAAADRKPSRAPSPPFNSRRTRCHERALRFSPFRPVDGKSHAAERKGKQVCFRGQPPREQTSDQSGHVQLLMKKKVIAVNTDELRRQAQAPEAR